MNKNLFLSALIISLSLTVIAQVPVREEPRHKPVLQNKYIRLLDVWLPPGDTTMYHIHATSSLFVVLSNTLTASQTQGATWVSDRSAAGKTWYRSFINDTLVHRVANIDSVPFHVNDIEILSFFDSLHPKTALSFPVLYENERAVAYQLQSTSLNNKVIAGRGPLIAELVSGKASFHDEVAKTVTALQAGKYMYIPPGSSFYFSSPGNNAMNMILFEIK
jgi:hypothetical protein